MSRLGSLLILPILAIGVVVVLLGSMTAANTARTKSTAQAPAAPRAVPAQPAALDATSGSATVTSTDLKFSAARIQARAGKVRLTLRNAGKVEHELVVLRTNADAAGLKPSASGRVSEAASVGEISETAPGASKSTTFALKPGHYVFVCNIPGHYAGGMHGTLTVT
jgi:uncharacterized cupredoxin-like copper-binding protein